MGSALIVHKTCDRGGLEMVITIVVSKGSIDYISGPHLSVES